MSDAGGKKIKIWDGIVEYDEPVPDTRAEVVKAAIGTSLTAFEKHKEALLGMLRDLKGVDLFLEAIARIEAVHGRKLTAHVVGQAEEPGRYESLS